MSAVGVDPIWWDIVTGDRESANSYSVAMLSKTIPRKIISLKAPASRIAADIEYRVVWNQISAHWEIHRNGAKTGASRRKKQSAIDIAILAIQSEERSPEAKVIVTSMKDRSLKTEWVGPSNKGDGS